MMLSGCEANHSPQQRQPSGAAFMIMSLQAWLPAITLYETDFTAWHFKISKKKYQTLKSPNSRPVDELHPLPVRWV